MNIQSCQKLSIESWKNGNIYAVKMEHNIAENASDLLTVILQDTGVEMTFETVMTVYDSQALDHM